MKVFDFNIHLPLIQSNNINEVIHQDMTLSVDELCQNLQLYYSVFKSLEGANLMLFNQNLLNNQNIQPFVDQCSNTLKHFLLTTLIDYSQDNVLEYIEKAYSQGIRAIMFNSYLQKIASFDHEKILHISKFAAEQGMLICIDTSYGTTKMYDYDNLKLACFIADHISESPIILIHSGGSRLIEAMLVALDKPNIYLDTSFSLPFYLGSSLEQDFAFTLNKIGSHRILFGSDNPYITFDHAVNQYLKFFEKYNFRESDIKNVMYHTAMGLLNE